MGLVGAVKQALAKFPESDYSTAMSQVADLIKEASKLGPLDRAELVASLLEDLDASPHHVSDEDALQRLEDLKPGRIEGMPEKDFWRACGRQAR